MKNVSPLESSFSPITAKQAQESALRNKNAQREARNEYLEKNVIPKIWETIHLAMEKGLFSCEFDCANFEPKITNEDCSFISDYFEDKYNFQVGKRWYNAQSAIICFALNIYWDMKYGGNMEVSKTQVNQD
jgi:hypothetical protein